ncbi:MAG TPA: type II toxin-antitoxin system RelE/ParE family toxin [Thermoplasmata archaeon]|nr:type II toxin-antitoxin system RelE/ParE family toxin [Thermoplasmata archaeon]
MYSLEIEESLSKRLKKLAKKDSARASAITKKVRQILEGPSLFKPLRGDLHGKYRVHVGPFVLIYKIVEERKAVRLLDFEHHDDAY